VPVLALSLGVAACGGSSNGSNGANVVTNKTSKAAATTIPVHIPAGPTGPPPAHRAERFSPATQQALAKFADCMRAKGIHMPEPNISGPGPVFDPKQMDTKNPHFAEATTACRTELLASSHSG
jgi:hypothetical protein